MTDSDEPDVQWLPDGTPHSPRFDDPYHSRGADGASGLTQAREVFLGGCGLPKAWQGQATWTVLETGFGLGLNFLATWDAWRADPQAPPRLHYVAVEAWLPGPDDLLRSAAPFPELHALARELAGQWPGLLPGWQCLRLDGGRVQLTLGVGDGRAQLREQRFMADSVYLDGFDPARNPDLWDVHMLKAVAQLCRRGTGVATWTVAHTVRDALAQCGFVVEQAESAPSQRQRLQGRWDPPWTLRSPRPARNEPASWLAAGPDATPRRALVIGAGLAGSSCAFSLARRGWSVTVLDRGEVPAAGASGLPAGLVAPHVSPDDRPLSRLTRAGVRATLQRAHLCLREGIDWAPSGVLEHRVKDSRDLPPSWRGPDSPAAGWSRPATADELAQAGLASDRPAHWHARAGWIRPAALVRAQLQVPGIDWRGGQRVARLARVGGEWLALDARGQPLGSAPLLMVAAGYDSLALLQASGTSTPPLHPLRGQIAWGLMPSPSLAVANAAAPLPPFPVNGLGSLIAGVPTDEGPAWYLGSTFERDCAEAVLRPEDTALNRDKLRALLPRAELALAPQFDAETVRTWAGVRCTVPDRVPVLGPLDAFAAPGLWVCTAMGARGITLSVLCGELAAAWLEAEPLPLDRRLAAMLAAGRWSPA
jgi:tRNA 5-methylaminomethyl-2-thiouridine biosynthesis bifunctional protein